MASSRSLATSGGYRYGVITSMMFTIATLSIVVLTGLIGQISLAQAALAGTGGFALSKLADSAGIGFPWSLILAGLIAAGFGVIVGLPALRIRGAQLAVVTLAAAVALERFVFRNTSFTKAEGNPIPSAKLPRRQPRNSRGFEHRPLAVRRHGPRDPRPHRARCRRTSCGRQPVARFIAVRSNERAGAATGINVAASKLLAFGIASFLAGIAGGLIGYSRGQLSADSFSTFVNVSFLAFAYLGGITAISGAIIGGAFAPLGIGFVLSDRLLNVGSVYTLVAGLGVILTAIFNPIGIAGANRHTWDKLKVKLAHRYGRPEPDLTFEEAPSAIVDEGPVIEPTASAAEPRVRHIRTADAEVLVRTNGLSVTYGGVRAVDEVDLEIQTGEIVGLIGPNGAGKTSFVDALTGFTSSSGTVEFMGSALETAPPHVRARRGLARTWQAGDLFDDLSVRENLRVAAERASTRSVVLDFVRPSRPTDQANVNWALDLVGLSEHADDKPTSLSIGQQKLLGVARALAARPHVVLLDEPAAGLDSTESRGLGERLHDIVDHGISVFLIDHDMGLVLETCDYIYVLEFGKLIAEGTPAEIRTQRRRHRGLPGRRRARREGRRRPRGGDAAMSAIKVRDLIAGHNGDPGCTGPRPRGRTKARSSRSWAQRSRQVHHALDDRRGAATHRRGDRDPRHPDPQRTGPCHRSDGLGPGPRGPGTVPPAHGGREPAPAATPQGQRHRQDGLRALPSTRRSWPTGEPGSCRAVSSRCWPLAVRCAPSPAP